MFIEHIHYFNAISQNFTADTLVHVTVRECNGKLCIWSKSIILKQAEETSSENNNSKKPSQYSLKASQVQTNDLIICFLFQVFQNTL